MARLSTAAVGVLVALLACVAVHAMQPSGGGPIIGLLVAPSPHCDSVDLSPAAAARVGEGSGSCVTWFYAKWLESAGARVAVIRYDEPADSLQKLISGVNGVLFPGGGLDLALNSTYVETASAIFDAVVKEGITPLFGTCMGFQLLHILASRDENVLARNAYDSEDLALALDAQPGAEQSRFAQGVGEAAWETLTTWNVTANLHHDGVPPDRFKSNEKITSMFQMLTTNMDRKGNPFVSTIEGINAPIYATQWHPERPALEWSPALNLNHTADSVIAMQSLANFYVAQARKSTHAFPSVEEEMASLIFAYPPAEPAEGEDSSYRIFHFPASA